MNKSHTVRVGNTTYANGATLARVMGIAKSTAYHRLKSDNFPDWQYIGEDEHIPVVETATTGSSGDVQPVEAEEKIVLKTNLIRITWLDQEGRLRTNTVSLLLDMDDQDIDRFARLGEELPSLCPTGVETCQFQIQGYSGEYNHTLKRIIIQSKTCSALIHIGSDLHITHYTDQNEPMYSDDYIEYLNTQTGYTTYYLVDEPPVNSKDVLYAHRNDWIPVWLNRELRELIPEEGNRQLVLGCPNLIETYLAFGKRHPRIDTFEVIRMVSSVRGEINRIKASGCSDRIVMTTRAGLINVFKNLDL